MFEEKSVNLDELIASKTDGELESIIARCESLLAERDNERKEKALEEARRITAAVGLQIMEKKTRKRGRRKMTKSRAEINHET